MTAHALRALLLLSLAQTVTSTPATPANDLLWDAPRPQFRAEEYAATTLLMGSIAALGLLVPTPPSGWQKGILVDDLILDAVVADSPSTRDHISAVSDILQDAVVAAPLLLDVGATALLARGDLELAGQLALIDIEAYVIAAAFIMLTKRTVGRVRPTIDPCPGTTDDFSCRSNASRRGFVSGHATASFTGAGLVCAHHHFMKLWGGAADDAACVGALALATGAALLRVPSGRHYPTDVLGGALAGLMAGYVAPYVLHFSKPRADPAAPITGAATLWASAGVLSTDGQNTFVGGMDLTLVHRYWLADTPTAAMVLGIGGRLYRSTEDIAVRQVSPWLGLWYRGVSLGAVIDYRSVGPSGASDDVLSAGPELSFGLPAARFSPRIGVRWLPLLDGDRASFAGRLDLALVRWFALRLEVQNLVGATSTSLATLSVGGRLPW